MAGPPLLPWEAEASVWMKSCPMGSFGKLETAPWVTVASGMLWLEQLVGQHHAGEAQDVNGIADLGLAVRDGQRRVGAVGHAQQGQVPPGFGERAVARCRT